MVFECSGKVDFSTKRPLCSLSPELPCREAPWFPGPMNNACFITEIAFEHFTYLPIARKPFFSLSNTLTLPKCLRGKIVTPDAEVGSHEWDNIQS